MAPTAPQTVAFLGLGAMGRPMAARLAQHGPTTVWNRTPGRAREHQEAHGTSAAQQLADLGPVDVVCSCLPTDVEVRAVAEQLAPNLAPGTVWLDHTSGAPAGARDLAALLADAGVDYLDAPVSGGTAGAEAGTLTTMVGGDPDALDRVRPVLAATTGRVVHVGPSGAGMAVKAVNNALLATSLWAAAEGLTALAAQGVPADRAIEVIATSSGRSFATDTLIPERVLDRSFPHTFALSLLAKDVGLAQGILDDAEVPAAVLTLVDELTRRAAEQLPGADHVELVRIVEQQTGIELSAGSSGS